MIPIKRRDLLKRGLFLSGGLTLLSGYGGNSLAAKPLFSGPKKVPALPADFRAYETTPPGLKARLFANENPFGPSAKAKQAIVDAINNSYQYPFLNFSILESKIQENEGLNKDQVLLAAGSSPLLLAAALHYHKGTIISATPTYEDLLERAEILGGKVVRVPLTEDHGYDLDEIEKRIDASTSLVYICNPNNPTATLTDAAKLSSFCDRVADRVTVFIDEAYIDYMSHPKAATLMGHVRKGKNVIIARTFSKLYGFAGLRVGYIAAQPAIIKQLQKYTAGPMSISAPSLAAAIAAYQDVEFLKEAYDKTQASKTFLYNTLKEEGYSFIPSYANFVMFPVKMDGGRFSEEMMKRGVGVRSWRYAGQEWCRVSIGTLSEMQAFASAFKEIS